jgi:hypothetical protein
LTAAAPVNPVQVEAGYEVDQIAKYFIFKHITKPCKIKNVKNSFIFRRERERDLANV